MGNMLLISKELESLGEDPITSTYNIDRQMEKVLMTREQREAERKKEETKKQAAQEAEDDTFDESLYTTESALVLFNKDGWNACLTLNILLYSNPEIHLSEEEIIKILDNSNLKGLDKGLYQAIETPPASRPRVYIKDFTDSIDIQKIIFNVKVLSYHHVQTAITQNKNTANKFYYVVNNNGFSAHTLEHGNQGIMESGLLVDDARFAVIHESWHTMARYDDDITPNAKWKFGSHNSKEDSIMFGSQRATLGKDRHLTGIDFFALNMAPPYNHLYFGSLPSYYKVGERVEIEGSGFKNDLYPKSELWRIRD